MSLGGSVVSGQMLARRHPVHAVFWRIRQFVHALRTRPDPAVDAELRRLLGRDDLWLLLMRLTPFDRAHHLRAHELLVEDGIDEFDVLMAALLHDIGKADDSVRAHAGHRALNVLLGRFAPALLERLTARPGHRVLHGLYLSRYHARLGAELARTHGASVRCIALIERHDEHGPFDDPGLAALVAADERAIR